MRTRRALHMATVSPMLKLAVRGISYFLDTIRTVPPTEDVSSEGKANEKLKSIYRQNAATIRRSTPREA